MRVSRQRRQCSAPKFSEPKIAGRAPELFRYTPEGHYDVAAQPRDPLLAAGDSIRQADLSLSPTVPCRQ